MRAVPMRYGTSIAHPTNPKPATHPAQRGTVSTSKSITAVGQRAFTAPRRPVPARNWERLRQDGATPVGEESTRGRLRSHGLPV